MLIDDASMHAVWASASGLVTATLTLIVAPLLRQRWQRANVSAKESATIEVARMDASDKFQERLMERIRDLEQRNNGLCESVARLAGSVDHLATVLAAASERAPEPGAVARD